LLTGRATNVTIPEENQDAAILGFWNVASTGRLYHGCASFEVSIASQTRRKYLLSDAVSGNIVL
jgi:hypothetical protein